MEILFLLALLAMFVLLVVLPANRRRREFLQIQDALAPGIEVVLTSGIYGTITEVSEDTIVLSVADGVQLTVARQAVGKILTPVEQPANEVQPEISPENNE